MSDNDPYQARWMALCSESPSSDVALEVYRDLRERYDESHRYYHNFDHVTYCLEQLDAVREELDSPWDFELAIWFHDAIYKPISRNNEEESADLARQQLRRMGVPSAKKAAVHHFVMLTKHPTVPQSLDEEYLIDIDLAILGEPPEVFNTYERNIRKEYKWVPGFVFRRKRAKLIQRILAQKSIYRSERFRDEREAQARENITAALAALT